MWANAPWEHPDWYDIHDTTWTAGPEREPEHYREMVIALPPLDADDHLLDAGCGTGKLAALVARGYPKLGRVTLLEPNALKLPRRLIRRFENGLGDRIVLDLLDLLRSLPEEKIGADRGAEDSDNNGEIGGGPFDMRNDKMEGDRSPWHANDEHRRDISEEREREPPQHGSIIRVAHEHFQERDENGERPHIEPLRAGQNELQSCAHRSQIGADVDDIGYDEQAHQRIEQKWGIAAPLP